MAYDLMILADPGPQRQAVLSALAEDPRIQPDRELDTRFWLKTGHGQAQVNIGTKDPVESVHVELASTQPALLEAAARWALGLAERLEMRVEDVQWGHEVTPSSL